MSDSTFDYERFCDDLGPAKIVHLHDPLVGLQAILVIDNVALGPSIGGVRMAPDVTTEEVFRLARAMTLKNAAAGLPHGGGKAGILADPKTVPKESLIRAFARAIRGLGDYIPGPDMGTDESCMAWIEDEIGRAVGLPRSLGGIPLDEIGATGWGLAACAEVAADFCALELDGATLAIEGFGNVGRPAARFLAEKGVRLVAASDSRGAVHDPGGIDVEELIAAKDASGSVTGHSGGTKISHEELFTVPCDILIPAARPDCIHEGNVAGIQAKLLLQGANIPATSAAETELHQRGILVVPDFIANAGGVICASVEYHGGSEEDALVQIAGKIGSNTREVLRAAHAGGVEPRAAAVALAMERVEEAMARGRVST
ncbi:MAG: Glu/Leu/Phe/Val dehydrogenase [Gemmatimonadota bacterium]|nr:Glu/Leu/Phe/Val dehydrogenase [Gemmatimonadota bacterium]MDH3421500.1 Glu/Leu/Phe/Val dehydrogenase [Gemmatimonadota bacterium]